MRKDSRLLRAGRASGGFTLFELLVVVLIIGLISALVMPRMAASLPGVQLKSTTRAVAASLRYARGRAVYESTPYVAVFDGTRNLLAVAPVENPMDAGSTGGIGDILDRTEPENAYEFPAGVAFDVPDPRDPGEDPAVFPIVFFPQGDSTGGRIVLKNLRGRHYTITVDAITGTVEVDGG